MYLIQKANKEKQQKYLSRKYIAEQHTSDYINNDSKLGRIKHYDQKVVCQTRYRKKHKIKYMLCTRDTL